MKIVQKLIQTTTHFTRDKSSTQILYTIKVLQTIHLNHDYASTSLTEVTSQR